MRGATATLALVAFFAVRECNAKGDCQDRGGRFVEYDCTTTVHCCTHTIGSSSSTTCQWRCEWLPAEDPGAR